MSTENYKMVFIGGLNSTFEKTDKDATLTLSQAILIPNEVSEYLAKMESECPKAIGCFHFYKG